MDTILENATLMKNRENLYRFLGNIYRKEIDQTFLNQMKEMTFPENCYETELNEGYQILTEYLKNSDNDTIMDLAVDYVKIFLAAGSSHGSAAFPYESVYTSRKKIVMQESWEEVCKIYAAKGLARGKVTKDILEDHIALELEFMAFLCKTDSNDGTSVSMLEEQLDFLTQHLLNWVPQFCEEIYKCADTMFYKAIGKITNGFLKLEKDLLDTMIQNCNTKQEPELSYCVSTEKMDEILQELKKEYNIYAPKRFAKRGAKNNTDLIRYSEINSIKEIEANEQSDFSPKEVYYPVSQVMLNFTETSCTESTLDDTKGILIFARPCDINGMKRLDTIFLQNGGNADLYYKRLRDKVKIIMLECKEGWENCFCVSMGSNQTDNYNLAVRFGEENIFVNVKDKEFEHLFLGETQSDFTPEFVQENARKAKIPQIDNREQLRTASNLEFWKDYDDRCIGCGGCNTVCSTCSCFDTVDIIYNESSRDGERRRVWSSCMLDSYTMTAGGNRARKTPGANMRFKTLHKIHDYNVRFGGKEHMCIGCGRCDKRCPKDISFFATINRFSDELEKVKSAENKNGEVGK